MFHFTVRFAGQMEPLIFAHASTAFAKVPTGMVRCEYYITKKVDDEKKMWYNDRIKVKLLIFRNECK